MPQAEHHYYRDGMLVVAAGTELSAAELRELAETANTDGPQPHDPFAAARAAARERGETMTEDAKHRAADEAKARRPAEDKAERGPRSEKEGR